MAYFIFLIYVMYRYCRIGLYNSLIFLKAVFMKLMDIVVILSIYGLEIDYGYCKDDGCGAWQKNQG